MENQKTIYSPLRSLITPTKKSVTFFSTIDKNSPNNNSMINTYNSNWGNQSYLHSPDNQSRYSQLQDKTQPVTYEYQIQDRPGKGLKFYCKIKLNNDIQKQQLTEKEQILDEAQNGNQNIKYRAFCAKDQNQRRRILGTNQAGIKAKVLNEYFVYDQDIKKLESTYGQDEIRYYFFDQIFTSGQSNLQIKQNFISNDLSKQIKNQKNGSLILFGNSKSGKSSSYFGNSQQNDSLLYTIGKDLLTEVSLLNQQSHHQSVMGQYSDKYSLLLQQFVIYDNQIYDLLKFNINPVQTQSKYSLKNQNISYQGLEYKLINDKADIQQLIINLTNTLTEYANFHQESQFLHKSHIFTQFSILKQANYTKPYNENTDKQNNNNIQYGKDKNIQNNIYIEQKQLQNVCKFSLVRLADLDIYSQNQELYINDFQNLKKYLNHVEKQDLNDLSLFDLCKGSNLTYCLNECCNNKTENSLLISVESNDFEANQKSIQFMDRYHNYSKSTVSTRPPLSPPHRDLSNRSTINSSNTNLKDIQLEALIQEIEQFTDQMVTSQYIVNKLSEKEKYDWVLEREVQLSAYSKQLDNANIGASQQKALAAENQLYLAQKTLKQIAQGRSGSPQREELDRVLNRESRMRTLQREKSLQQSIGKLNQTVNRQNQQSPKREQQIRELKSKEEKLDKDFSRLLERYNQSKQIVDNLCNNRVKSPSSPQISCRSTLLNSRYQSPKIQKISDLPSEINKQQSIGKNKSVTIAPEILNNELQQQMNREQNYNQSLKRLKQTIQVKETLEKEKIEKLQVQNRELKINLKEQLQKNQELDEQILMKDDIIVKYENELKNAQEDLLLNVERIKEMRIKEESWIKLEDQLAEQIMQLKGKLARKKTKLRSIRDSHNELQKQSLEDSERRQIEMIKLNNQLDQIELLKNQFKERAQICEETNKKLEEELNELSHQNQEMNQTNRNLEQQLNQIQENLHTAQTERDEQIKQNQIHNQRIEQLQDTKTALEAKINKIKTQFEVERNEIKQENQQKMQKKKEKIQNMKEEIKEQEQKIQHQEKVIMEQERNIQTYEKQAEELNQEITEAKQQQQQHHIQLQETQQKNSDHGQEIERLNNLIKNLEEKLKNSEQQNLQDIRIIQELKQDNSQINEDNSQIRDALARTESELEYIQKQQNIEINDIEIRIDALIAEIKQLKDENSVLRETQTSLKKELNISEDLQNNFKEKYIRAKNINKQLRDHIKTVEDKVKDFMHERDIENREISRQRELKRIEDEKSKNKIRVLDDIQNMIKRHKISKIE